MALLCEHCQKTFPTNASLYKHKYREHNKSSLVLVSHNHRNMDSNMASNPKKRVWEVGRLAPDSLCNVYATSMQQQKNTLCNVYATSLHNEHSMHTPCTVSLCNVYATSMQRLCNVPAQYHMNTGY